MVHCGDYKLSYFLVTLIVLSLVKSPCVFYSLVSYWLEGSEINAARHSARLPTNIYIFPPNKALRYFLLLIIVYLFKLTTSLRNTRRPRQPKLPSTTRRRRGRAWRTLRVRCSVLPAGASSSAIQKSMKVGYLLLED